MPVLFRVFVLAACLLGFSGCALLKPIQEPSVELVGLQMLPASGMEQRMRVFLRVVNPNDIGIAMNGLNVGLALAGYDVLTGVSDQHAELPALGETRVQVDLSLNLLSSLGLLQTLMSKPEAPLDYTLKGRLYVDHALLPDVRINRSGKIDLNTMLKQPRNTRQPAPAL